MFTTVKTGNSIRNYLREISRYPLLSASEEIELGQQVQLMMNPPDDVSLQELECIQRQGQRAKEKMVNSNLKLVVSVAKKYQKRDLEFLDLIQEGTIGLIRGVERFDPTQGFKLSTYSYWWIRQAITRAIAERGRVIRLPIHVVEKLNRLKKCRRELTQKLGRTPTLAELAEALETTSEQVSYWLEVAQRTSSIDMMVGKNYETPLLEMFPSELPSPEALLEAEANADYVQELLTHCTEHQRQVISMRFGLSGSPPLTMEQVGERMGLSKGRVRQLQAGGFERIRKRKSGC